MLIYSSSQLLWKCSSGYQADGGLTQPNHGDSRSWYRIDDSGLITYDDGSKMTEEGRNLIFGEIWEDIVQESARRKLTVPGDKLNALEGIVQELRRITRDECLAGLWRSRLVSELAWYQDASNNDSDSMIWNSERSCPSWSWTKTDGSLSFSHAENSAVVVLAAMITRNETVGEHPNLRLVVEGSIVLRAPMSTLPLDQSLPTFKFPNPGSSKQAFSNSIYLDGALTNPDFLPETVDGTPIIPARVDMRFMELSWGKMSGYQNVAQESRGLVLLPVADRPNTYRRSGFFVVGLEYDPEEVGGDTNLLATLSFGPKHVLPTEFGKIWKASLREEVVTII